MTTTLYECLPCHRGPSPAEQWHWVTGGGFRCTWCGNYVTVAVERALLDRDWSDDGSLSPTRRAMICGVEIGEFDTVRIWGESSSPSAAEAGMLCTVANADAGLF